MDNTSIHALIHTVLHQIQGIRCCLPAVDHKWHMELPGNLHLLLENFLLKLMLPSFLVPVIIQSDLANSNRLFQATTLPDLIQHFLCHQLRIIRMNPKSTIHKRIFLHQCLCLFQTVYGRTHINNFLNSIFIHRTKKYIPVLIKSLIVIMCMCFKNLIATHLCSSIQICF